MSRKKSKSNNPNTRARQELEGVRHVWNLAQVVMGDLRRGKNIQTKEGEKDERV